jgi:hypothetical protein
MKRERIKIEAETTSNPRHSFRSLTMRWIPPEEMSMRRDALAAMKLAKAKGVKLTFKKAMQQQERRLDYKKNEATAADSYVTRLMNEAAAAQRLVKDAKAYEAECWAKLSRYLADGTRDDGKRPRIRIVDHADVPARGPRAALPPFGGLDTSITGNRAHNRPLPIVDRRNHS